MLASHNLFEILISLMINKSLTSLRDLDIISKSSQKVLIMSKGFLAAQMQRYRITLDVKALPDFDPHQIDWSKVLELQGRERAEAYVEDLDCPDRW